VLALFCIASAILFHANLADQNQFIHLLKNIAIAGGFLTLAAHDAGSISIDILRRKTAIAGNATARMPALPGPKCRADRSELQGSGSTIDF